MLIAMKNILKFHFLCELRFIPFFLLLAFIEAPPAVAAIGRTPGEFAVNASGAATYLIPIDVAEAAGGMRPRIALSFNSRVLDGVAGVGWGLTGFSEISRCGLSLALDGMRQGVTFTDQDRFCLDGKPLIAVGGSVYGGHNAEYRAEIHSYQKVTSHLSAGTGPQYFKVEMPGGLTYLYGDTANSRIEAPNSNGEVRVWALRKVLDKYNNSIVFEYNERNNGEYDPRRISWGQGNYSLRFLYTARPDKRSGFVSGTPWARTKRLINIKYKFQGALVHDYRLAYMGPIDGIPDTGRSRLLTVTQCAGADCLPATKLTWGFTWSGWSDPIVTPGTADQILFDFDGDGDMDRVNTEGGAINLSLSDGGVYSAWQYIPGLPVDTRPCLGCDDFRPVPLDYNGDGLMDLLVVTDSDDEYHVYVSNADGHGFWCGRFCVYDTGLPRASTAPLGSAAFDMDGDGLDDLIYLRGSALKYRRNLGAQFGPEEDAGLNSGGNYSMVINRNLPQPDFNGDGRKDLLLASIQCSGGSCGTPNPGFTVYYDMYLSNGDSFATSRYGTTSSFVGPLSLRILTPDINGDGLSDAAFEGYPSGTWQTMISNGKGFNVSNDTSIEVVNGQFADYNGDGLTDLLESQKVYLSGGNSYSGLDSENLYLFNCVCIQVADANGDGFADLVSDTRVWLHFGDYYSGDVVTRITDGLGNYHKLTYAHLSNSDAYVADRTSGIQQTLTTSGAAVVGTFPRSPVTRYIYGAALQVVTSTEQSATYGDSWPFTTTYKYWNAQVDMRGRGFLGFAQIRSVDDRNGQETTALYHQDFPYVGRLKFRRTLRGAIGPREELLRWGAYTRLIEEPGGLEVENYFVRQESSDDFSYQDSSTRRLIKRVEHVYTWDDDHGAVSIDDEYIHTDTWEGRDRAFHTQRKALNAVTGLPGFDTGLMVGSWCLGRATRMEITKSFPDALPATESRITSSVYDPDKCTLTQISIGSPSEVSRQLKTRYKFDTKGRTVSVTENNGDDSLSARVTMFDYPPNGWSSRAVKKSLIIAAEENPSVHSSWNEALDLVAEAINEQGLTTKWQFDGFGRLTHEQNVTRGTFTDIAYQFCSNWCPADRTKYTIAKARSDGFWSKEHFDSWGRRVGEAHALLAGQSRKETYHDRLPGRKTMDSLRFVNGETQYSAGFTYDDLGRLVESQRPVDEFDTQFPGSAVTRWVHEHDTVKKQDSESRSTWYLFRPDGKIHQVTETPLTTPSVTEYRYTPFGELASVSDPDDVGPATTVEYDVFGYPSTRVDADSGESVYKFNVFGELAEYQDSQGSITTVEYDQLGRIRSRVENIDNDGGDEITSWDYVSYGQPGSGLLETVTGPTSQLPVGGFSKRFTYNNLAQLTGTMTQIEGSVYETGYTYNAQGRVNKMVYPETLDYSPEFTYHYVNGFLQRVDQAGGVGTVFEVTSTDASGRVKQSVSGGGFISSQINYDRGTERLTGFSTDLYLQSGGASIQDYVYRWDGSGNLTERRDRNAGLIEEFAYDDLNRLTATSLNAQLVQSITYHPDGRIKTRVGEGGDLGVGTYIYENGNNSDAVTSIVGDRNNTYHYDGNGNMDCRGDTSSLCTNGDLITWYSFGKPNLIRFRNGARVNSAKFEYGPDRQRIKQASISAVGYRNIEYVDSHFEREVQGNTTRYRSNVFAYGQVVYALHESRKTTTCEVTFASNPYFVHRDHQGSVDQLTLWDVSGSGAVAMSYDAFGKRRNSDWSPDDSDLQLEVRHIADRGYTGHEHLDNVRLIHMNGRVQDPIIGLMISPDPFTGNLANPQSLNRYSYALNSPASVTDPTGFCEAGSDGNEGSCPSITRRQVGLIADLVRADNSIKGAGKVIAGIDTAVALGAYASSLGANSFMVGSLDVVNTFANRQEPELRQYSIDDGHGGLVTVTRANPNNERGNRSLGASGEKFLQTGAGKEIAGFGGAEAGSDMFLLFFGVSGSSGVIFDNQKVCGFNQTCFQLGFGGYLGITGQGIAGLGGPLEEGSMGTLGLFAIGSAGAGGFGTLDVNSSNLTLGGGFSSGIGGATGAQFCRMDIFGCN
jgi:RHS repeat-associated protein